jgi:Ca2+-binding EF-hand superfamily protein
MGGSESVPAPDLRVKRAMALSKMDMKDVGHFWKKFRKLDKEMRGNIDIEDFYSSIEERRSIYGDGVFELLDINHAGTITFGEFIQCIIVMCLFEKDEIMKFCFYVFDKDKNGYVEKAELDTMLHVFHHIDAGEKLKGNPKKARNSLKIGDDGKVEFAEVCQIAEKYPSLWYPALRIQNNMMIHYMGNDWWEKKKRLLQDLKDLKARRKREKAMEAEAKFERLRQRKIRKKMGVMKYYCCPWNRKQWDKMFPRHQAEVSTALSAEELAELRKKAREEAKRLEELLIKNPETQEWRNYVAEKDAKLKLKWAKEKGEADGSIKKPRPKASVSERVARTERRREKFSKSKHAEA